MPALAALAVFANAVPNQFALDDVDLVHRNPQIRSLTGVPGLFVEPYWPGMPEAGLHRPLTIASFAVNRALTGPGPAGFHAVNVLLHALVSLLAWQAARRAGVHYGTALAAGLLFAVHPLHAEAVANIAGRAELLAALGVLAAWLCHRRAFVEPDGGRRTGWGAGAAACYLLALLSKEHAIVAPVVFLIDDRLRLREGGDPGRFSWRGYGAYALVLAAAGVLRLAALGGFRGAETTAFLDNPAAFADNLGRLGTALWVQVKYAVLFFAPTRLSSDYSFDAIPVVESVRDARFWMALAFIAALCAVFVVGCRRSRPLAVGVAWWALFFLPTSNLLFASGTVMAERLAYLPSFGGCLLAGHGIAWLASKGSPLPDVRRLRVALPIVVTLLLTLLLGAKTWTRNPAWRDNATLATRDALTMPRSAKLHAGAGIAQAAAGDTGTAEQSFRQAIGIYPDYAQVRFNLGQLLMQRGERAEAIEHLARAAWLSPANPRPHKSLATLYEQAGNREEALAAYAAAARLDPADLPLRFNYGRALLAAGRTAKALEVLSALADEAPESVSGQLAGALAHESRGDGERAAGAYRALLGRSDLPEGVRRNVIRRLAASSEPR